MESADLAARNFWGVSVPSALAAFARVLVAASGTKNMRVMCATPGRGGLSWTWDR